MIYRVYTITPDSTTKDQSTQAVTGKNIAILSAVPRGQNHLSICGEQEAMFSGQRSEVRGQGTTLPSLFSPFTVLNSACQAWWPTPLPTELSPAHAVCTCMTLL